MSHLNNKSSKLPNIINRTGNVNKINSKNKISTENVIKQATIEFFSPSAGDRHKALHVLYLHKNKMSIDDKKKVLVKIFEDYPDLIGNLNFLSKQKLNEVFEELKKIPDINNIDIRTFKKFREIIGVNPFYFDKNFMPNIRDALGYRGGGIKLLAFEKGKYPKKYNAILEENGKIKKISFGDQRYQQFKDSTPLKLYSNLDHNDLKRRENYYKRHNKDYPKFSADYFAKRFLW